MKSNTSAVDEAHYSTSSAGLSFPNTVLFPDVFCIDHARSTVHNWVDKADLQPTDGKTQEYVGVDNTVIRLDDEQYLLYSAVHPDSNDLPHSKFERTKISVIVEGFFAELREKHEVDGAVFLVDDETL